MALNYKFKHEDSLKESNCSRLTFLQAFLCCFKLLANFIVNQSKFECQKQAKPLPNPVLESFMFFTKRNLRSMVIIAASHFPSQRKVMGNLYRKLILELNCICLFPFLFLYSKFKIEVILPPRSIMANSFRKMISTMIP